MKVFFVNPPVGSGKKQIREGRCMLYANAWASLWPPISMAFCAAVVREKGVEVKLVDCIAEDIVFFEFAQLIKDYNPDMVVVNTATPSIVNDLSTLEYIKGIDKNIKTAIIGVHGTVLADDCFLLSPGLDFVVRGEPEDTVSDLVLAIKHGNDISQVKGISYRRADEIINNPDREFIDNLDELPYPAWDLIDLSKYRLPFNRKKFLLIIPARGCPHRCTFCNSKVYYGNALRLRSAEKVVDELVWCKEKFGIDEFLFWTESFTLNREFAQSVADEILARKLKISWICNSRVDNVDKDLLDKFKKAGCWMIGYGIESGDEKIIKNSKKGTNLVQAINAVSLAKNAGLDVVAYYVFGLPGETVETVKKTIKFANKLNTNFAQFYCATPFPGCELFEEAKRENWINTDDWSKFEQNYSVLNIQSITAREVMAFRKKAYLFFYCHPRRIYMALKKVISIKTLINLFKTIKDFSKWIYKS